MSIREIIVYSKQCYGRSMGYIGYLTAYLIITANIKLFEVYINNFGISIPQAIIISIPLFVFGNLIVGHLDLKYGIWKQENDFTWNMTPAAKELSECTKRIEMKLNEK